MADIREHRSGTDAAAMSTIKLDSPLEEKQQLDDVPAQQPGPSWRDGG